MAKHAFLLESLINKFVYHNFFSKYFSTSILFPVSDALASLLQ